MTSQQQLFDMLRPNIVLLTSWAMFVTLVNAPRCKLLVHRMVRRHMQQHGLTNLQYHALQHTIRVDEGKT